MATEKKARRAPDPEVKALKKIVTILSRFDGETQERMLRYLLQRHGAGRLLGPRWREW